MLYGKWRAFVLTWLAYAGLYLTRKNVSAAKFSLQAEEGLSLQELGMIDSWYLGAYAVGQIPCGVLVDLLGAKDILVAGLIGSAVSSFLFGQADRFGGSKALMMSILFGFNGLFQATGWPSNVRVMSLWYREAGRGTVMGIWSTNYQIGGVVATVLAGYLISEYGWRLAFTVPAVVVFSIAVLNAAFLSEGPDPDDPEYSPIPSSPDSPATQQKTSVSHYLTDIRVIQVAGSYFFLKMLRYSLLFWLPYYLSTTYGIDSASAAYMSTSLEIGGFIGVICIGALSDNHPASFRPILSGYSLLLLSVMLMMFSFNNRESLLIVYLPVIGFLLFGPDSLLVGTVGQDIGGNKGSGTVCSIINAVGSLGAFFQGYVTTGIVTRFGWSYVFVFFSLTSMLASVIILYRHIRQQASSPTTEVTSSV